MEHNEKWDLISMEGGHSDGGPCTTTYRLRVLGGWLYRVMHDHIVNSDARSTAVAMTFVPDLKNVQDPGKQRRKTALQIRR